MADYGVLNIKIPLNSSISILLRFWVEHKKKKKFDNLGCYGIQSLHVLLNFFDPAV